MCVRGGGRVGVRVCACVWGGEGEGVFYILVCLLYVHIVCVFIVPRKLEGNHITHVGADDLKPYLALMSL